MKTKLTLSVDQEIIDMARSQAKREGLSISKMFSNLVDIKSQAKSQFPSTRDIVGSLKGYSINDSKRAIHDEYARKYLH